MQHEVLRSPITTPLRASEQEPSAIRRAGALSICPRNKKATPETQPNTGTDKINRRAGRRVRASPGLTLPRPHPRRLRRARCHRADGRVGICARERSRRPASQGAHLALARRLVTRDETSPFATNRQDYTSTVPVVLVTGNDEFDRLGKLIIQPLSSHPAREKPRKMSKLLNSYPCPSVSVQER